jgi:adenine-specific DNA-methyltransferase
MPLRPNQPPRRPRPQGGVGFKRPPLNIQVTTLWDYPSQDYGDSHQGVPGYKGATPSYIIWNLLQRYTAEKELVVDCFAGSGTTLDVARDLNRKSLGYDVHPVRKDIFRVDARKLPPELTGKVDFVFIDPPYGTHLDYGDDPRDIGKLDLSAGPAYYDAMDQCFAEIKRILKPDRHMALYVSDSYEHRAGKGVFHPVGFELYARLRKHFEPADVISVVRHNKTLEMGNYRKAAEEGNYFLRGFNYLLVMKKAAQP